MTLRNRHRPGDHLYCCQECDDTVYASETRVRWDNRRVCSSCWERRNPQDFVRARKDKIAAPFSNPPAETFITIPASGVFMTWDSGDKMTWDSGDNVIWADFLEGGFGGVKG